MKRAVHSLALFGDGLSYAAPIGAVFFLKLARSWVLGGDFFNRFQSP